jgi:ketosteroid isomerase-like protein
MPDHNVDIVRELYRSIQWLFDDDAGDAMRLGIDDPAAAIRDFPKVGHVVGFMTEDVTWKTVFAPEPVIGREAVVQLISEWMEVMAQWRVVDEVFTDVAKDVVLGDVKAVQSGRESGVPIEQPLFITYTMRDGRIARYWEFFTRDEALASLEPPGGEHAPSR